MSAITELAQFERQREAVLHDLSEERTKRFEEWTDGEEKRRLTEIDKRLTEANDAQPNAAADDATQANPNLAEFQKALERKGEAPSPWPSLESRIQSARDV